MSRNLTQTILRLTLLGLTALSFQGYFACSEREVGYAVDADELRLFIAGTELGKSLFRADSMIVPTPFRIPNDTTLYYDSVIKHVRSIVVDTSRSTSAGYADWGQIGKVREAMASVNDRYTVVRRAVNNPSFVPDTSLRSINRYGFFLKLGDDSWPYLGWDLFGYAGFAGNLPVVVPIEVRASDNSPLGTFYGDNSMLTFSGKLIGTAARFVEVRDLINRGPGTRFNIRTELSTTQTPSLYYFTVTGAQPTGRETQAMTRITREEYVDTVVLPTERVRLYDFLFVQAFDDTSGKFYLGWCIPYKTP
jgi:hypothetical protein